MKIDVFPVLNPPCSGADAAAHINKFSSSYFFGPSPRANLSTPACLECSCQLPVYQLTERYEAFLSRCDSFDVALASFCPRVAVFVHRSGECYNILCTLTGRHCIATPLSHLRTQPIPTNPSYLHRVLCFQCRCTSSVII